MNNEQLSRMTNGKGFIAALDQSGGSTPKALKTYGLSEDSYKNEEEMFDLVHKMRTRIMTSPAFTSEKVVGAILFEGTMERNVADMPAADYLWKEKGIVPFLKIDKGLQEEQNGVQLLKEIPDLDKLLEKAKNYHIFGTKERSVIKLANKKGITEVVSQQFDLGKKVVRAGLIPIIEPEVAIDSPEKEAAETILFEELKKQLDALEPNVKVMLKLTLPTQINLYKELVTHPNIIRIVALSGGYAREEANQVLAKNQGVIASFSRALTEGLTANQSEDSFNESLKQSIEGIYQASIN